MERKTLKDRLAELKRNFDEGLIPQTGYEAQVAKLLAEGEQESSSDPFAAVSEGKGNKDTVFTLKAGDEIGPEDQRFILQEILGQGGMGQVWLARDLQEEAALGGGRECFKAVKVLPPELLNDKRSMAGLEREALRASKLNHAGVVNVFGLRKDPRRRMPFLIMEALEGHDLDEELTRAEASGQTGVGWARMLAILGPVARTLDEIYDDYDGLIHRDLKPGNIFLTPNGKSKILDFGLAYQLRRSSQRLSKETGDTSSGTPDYMPPEAFAHGEPDRRQDIYALACIAYELLTGSPPYPREAVRDRPRDLYPAQPNELGSEQWVSLKKGLAYRKEERPATAGELLSLLQRSGWKPKWAEKPKAEEKDLEEKKGGFWKYSLLGGALLAGVGILFFNYVSYPERSVVSDEPRPQTAILSRPLTSQAENQRSPQTQSTKDQQQAELSREKKRAAESATDPYTGMEFVYVKPGCFQMGSPAGESGRDSDEHQYRVCLTQGYDLGKYEVTQAQWRKVMGGNPSHFSSCGENCPVEKVSWNDVQEFIQKLNRKTGRNYRLPTEAEWEYACRSGGKSQKYCGGDIADRVAWFWDNTGKTTHPVGRKQPNGLGLYDMSGNVWEWMQDWYNGDYYRNSPVNDPKGPSGGSNRVLRGGSWGSGAGGVRSAIRYRYEPGSRSNALGFRLARTR